VLMRPTAEPSGKAPAVLCFSLRGVQIVRGSCMRGRIPQQPRPNTGRDQIMGVEAYMAPTTQRIRPFARCRGCWQRLQCNVRRGSAAQAVIDQQHGHQRVKQCAAILAHHLADHSQDVIQGIAVAVQVKHRGESWCRAARRCAAGAAGLTAQQAPQQAAEPTGI
jgi:hypothetical protein